MAPTSTISDRPTSEPTWDVARLFPNQGHWSEDEYLALNTNQLVEFSHGVLEFPPMPTFSHQRIAFWLSRRMEDFVSQRRLGVAVPAPFKVQVREGKYREPDVSVMLHTHAERMTEQFWIGADLVVEVVSDDDRRRDLETKRNEYAMAEIPEYWIVDPKLNTITVLVLDGTTYAEHGVFTLGERATSRLLAGLEVNVTATFDAATM